MQTETGKFRSLIEDDDEAPSADVAAPVTLTLVATETKQPWRLKDHPVILWSAGTFTALLAAEVHGAAGVLMDSSLVSETVRSASALASALSVIVAVIAASFALLDGWRYLERWTFLKFVAALLPSMFAGQIAGLVVSNMWLQGWLAKCWNDDLTAFTCGEFQTEFGVLLAGAAVVGAIAANVVVVIAWREKSEAAGGLNGFYERMPGVPSRPVETDNIIN